MKHNPLLLLKRTLYGAGFMSLLCYAINSSAYSYQGGRAPPMFKAQVLDKNGLPCFTVKSGKNVTFGYIVVGEVSIDMKTVLDGMWAQTVLDENQQSISLDYPSCFLYGTELADKYNLEPAKQLKSGKFYEAIIWARVGTEHHDDNIRHYMVHFCLVPIANGGTKVHEVSYNEKKKEWNFDVCNYQ